MDIFEVFATDEVAEVEGRWFPLSKTSSIKLARTYNPAYRKAMRQRMKDAQIDSEDSSQETEDLVNRLIAETLAETVLLDWKGLSYKGQPITYSSKNATMMLTTHKEFRKRVTDIADKAESFRAKEEEAQGNV